MGVFGGRGEDFGGNGKKYQKDSGDNFLTTNDTCLCSGGLSLKEIGGGGGEGKDAFLKYLIAKKTSAKNNKENLNPNLAKSEISDTDKGVKEGLVGEKDCKGEKKRISSFGGSGKKNFVGDCKVLFEENMFSDLGFDKVGKDKKSLHQRSISKTYRDGSLGVESSPKTSFLEPQGADKLAKKAGKAPAVKKLDKPTIANLSKPRQGNNMRNLRSMLKNNYFKDLPTENSDYNSRSFNDKTFQNSSLVSQNKNRSPKYSSYLSTAKDITHESLYAGSNWRNSEKYQKGQWFFELKKKNCSISGASKFDDSLFKDSLFKGTGRGSNCTSTKGVAGKFNSFSSAGVDTGKTGLIKFFKRTQKSPIDRGSYFER